jgi:nitrite reductase/ring-hydroxylating ferredoxin subunit
VSWHSVATLEEAERARPWLAARVGDTDLVLAREAGAWFAVQARCTHAGCPFAEEATLEDGTIVCNCHGSEFALRSGEVRRGPAEYPLRTFSVRVSDGGLEVEL